MKQKIIVIGLIIGLIFGLTLVFVEIDSLQEKLTRNYKAYELLNKKLSDLTFEYDKLKTQHDELKTNYDYAIEMNKECMKDPTLCQKIKKSILESKIKDDLI